MSQPDSRNALVSALGTPLARACLLAVVLAAPSGAVRGAIAATITVTTTEDELNADGDCALREAIRAANTNLPVDTCTAGSDTETDTIVVPAGTYTLERSGADDVAVSGDLDLVDNFADEDLVINGAGASLTIIQACTVDQKTAPCPPGQGVADRVFHNVGAHVTLEGMTIRNGSGQEGGGLFNQFAGVVTLSHSLVTANAVPDGFSGGGVSSQSGALIVVDSAVTHNRAGQGGGIQDIGPSVLSVTRSTVSDNVSLSSGGGIGVRAGGTATITNATISGNTAIGAGGGLSGASAGIPSFVVLDIRSSTITKNTVPDTSQRASGLDLAIGAAAIRNSVVAGNVHVSANPFFQLPDCAGSVISEGYNLIGDDTGCTLTTATGDRVGTAASPIDPLLGPLQDNGGPTPTHLLLAGSLAISAGNPAPPGSGGFSCPLTDQRGVARPQGAACDSGALELEGTDDGFGIVLVHPGRGGNAGSVLTRAYGTGFIDGAVLKLTRPGAPDVVGAATTVGPGGTVITTALDLAGAATGLWSVVVTNPGATSATLVDAFTVEAGGRADLWVDVMMPAAFVFGRITSVYVYFGNRGSVDAFGAPLWLSFPDDLQFRLPFPISAPPTQAGQVLTDWSEVPVDVAIEPPEDRDSFPLLLPIVPAGFTGVLKFRLKAPLTIDPGRNASTLTFAIGKPYLGPGVSPGTIARFVERAKDYASKALGTNTFPADATIEQYVRTQLSSVLSEGRAEAVARVAQLPVYSLAQLLVDTGQFIAAGGAANLASLDRTPAGPPRLTRLVADSWGGARGPRGQIIDPDCDPQDIWCERVVDCQGRPPFGVCAKDPPLGDCDKFRYADEAFIFLPCNPKSHPTAYRGSHDPNDKIGPGGPDGFTDGLTPIPYNVLFENQETATASAQEVFVSDQLDVSRLAVESFSLGPVSFGQTQVFPPPGLSSFTTDVDLRPDQDLLVRIDAALDASTGIATWSFSALDPATGELPEDPLVGFLPPNVTPPEGEGAVLFTVSPQPGLARGTDVCNSARIVFDVNPPIDTPEWCNVIGTPEDCANCRDDDGDGLVDRADPDCTPADGGGAGLADPTAAKALDKCAKAFRKVGSKLAGARTKQVEACLNAVGSCVQLKAGDPKCLAAARARCGKAKNALLAADAKATAAIAKTCGAPSVMIADLGASAGIGFDSEVGLCAEGGVPSLGTLADVTECVRSRHACAAERLIAAAVPRAAELLTLGGWEPIPDLPCIDEWTNGGGSAVPTAKRKALRRCDRAIQKATAAFVTRRSKAEQACGAAVFTCLQTKPGDPKCLAKAGRRCTKTAGALPRLTAKFTAAIGKACGRAPLEPADLLGPEGLGAGALADTCQALGVPSLSGVADVSSCLARQATCRTDEMLVSQTPRLGELLDAGGVGLPRATASPRGSARR